MRDEKKLSEYVQHFRQNRPRWVVIRGRNATGRTTLAKMLCVEAVREFGEVKDQLVEGTTAQLFWYDRDDTLVSRMPTAQKRCAEVVRMVSSAELPELPITYVPKKFAEEFPADDVVDLTSGLQVAVVFDDIVPDHALMESLHRRFVSRGVGALIVTATEHHAERTKVLWAREGVTQPIGWHEYAL